MKKIILLVSLITASFAATYIPMELVKINALDNSAFRVYSGKSYEAFVTTYGTSPWVVVPSDVKSVAVEMSLDGSTNHAKVETTICLITNLINQETGIIWAKGALSWSTNDGLSSMVTAVRLVAVSNFATMKVRAQ